MATTLVFVAVKQPDESLAPQAVQIVNLLHERGRLTRDELIPLLGQRLTGSRQPPGRVFSFYKGVLVKQGYLQELVEGQPAPEQDESTMSRPIAKLSVRLRPFSSRAGNCDIGLMETQVLRAFKVDDAKWVLMCGNDVDDHELWLVNGEAARLIGDMSSEQFREAIKAKEFTVFPDQLSYCGEWFRGGRPLEGKHVTSRSIGFLAEKTFDGVQDFENEEAQAGT